jgi:hypothetical protein
MSSVATNAVSTPINVRLPAAPVDVETDFLRLGDYQHPSRTLRVNSRYLELDQHSVREAARQRALHADPRAV